MNRYRKKALKRSSLRDVKGSFGRFFAIFAIIALGVGFFSGVRITTPTMVRTINEFYDEKHFFDYRLVSTVGWDDENLEAVRNRDLVIAAEGCFQYDVILNGKEGDELKNDDKVWELEADYLAQALVNIILILQPQRIILGGGVMHQKQLFPLIRQKVKIKINNYLKTKELENIDEYIIPCSLNDKQGILGSFKIGIDKYYEELNKNK